MKNDLGLSYSQFAQNFIEHEDEYRGLKGEEAELLAEGEEIPQSLINEIHRHELIIGVFLQVGKEKFNKERKEIYNDGWNFWMKEDAELREARYGNK